MKIAVIGTGYVGLVTGVCLAEIGHQVICVDNDDKKVSSLKKGRVKIHEDNLEELVKNNLKELDRISFVFNLDSIFSSTAEGTAVMWSPPMRDYLKNIFRQTQCNVDVRNCFCMSGDYLPFMLEGITAARPADWKNSYPNMSHTYLDTPARVPPNWIRYNAMTYAQMLARVLMDPKPLPVKRKTPQDVKELIEKEKPLMIISVGDIVSGNMVKHGIFLQVLIVDNKAMREPITPIPVQSSYQTLHAKNPPGTLTDEAWFVTQEAIKQEKRSYRHCRQRNAYTGSGDQIPLGAAKSGNRTDYVGRAAESTEEQVNRMVP